ncbi:hypothetical protein [Rivibacter subsaxonicus]|uniref:Uncharacterized protein n=1 Tax=Rivibacter subsaxonicus TaxID=457575 RepID=A0A4Q7VCJ4_9BURK|nr:hypothetical protein [Rivibacter subsaxonicus]RZT93587.1 hypothetical protein EV670_3137 [Rivibacter subsaxonicus]
MRTIEQHSSPDGQLTLAVVEHEGGEVAVGFKGGEWHTHSDLLAEWLCVPAESAVSHFVELVLHDKLSIVVSTDRGLTLDPWVSDNLAETLRLFGPENCVLRYWSNARATA